MRIKTLLLTVLCLFSITITGSAQTQMYLDHVDGLTPENTLTADGVTPIVFHIGMNNNTGSNVKGWTNGFQIYTTSGAEWTVPANDTIGYYTEAILPTMAEQKFVNQFSIDGMGADTVGFGGFSLFAAGIPAGFNDIVWTINIGTIDANYNGGEICLDSTFYPPAGAWSWSTTSGSAMPTWDGPHCFGIGTFEPNTEPTIATLDDRVIIEGDSILTSISATDPDGDDLTFSAIQKPLGATLIDNGNGTAYLAWSTTIGDAGFYTIIIEVSDGELTDTETYTVTVNPFINTPPIIAPIMNRTVNVGDPLDIFISATDANMDPLTFSTSTIPVGAIFDDNGNGTASFSWTPLSGQAGVYPITISVTDGIDFDDEVFTITVDELIQGQSMFSVDHVSGLIEGNMPVDGSTATINIRLDNGNSNITGYTNGFRIYSENGATWTTTLGELTGAITPAILEQNFINSFSEDGMGADTVGFGGFRLFAPGIPTGFSEIVWTLTVGPFDQLDIGKSICIDTSYYPPAGNWTWSTVTGDIIPDWFDQQCWSIGGDVINNPPVLNPIGNMAVNEGINLNFGVSATDIDGDPLTYSIIATNLPVGYTFVGNIFDWTPTFDDAGVYSVTFQVSDGMYTDEETISITVYNVSQAMSSLSLDHVDGLTLEGKIPFDTPLTFHIRMTNNAAGPIYGWTNGFRIYSPDGAQWMLPASGIIGSFTDAILPSMIEEGNKFVNQFSVDGMADDTVGFGGFRIFAAGIPAGFDDIVWTINLAGVPQASHDKYICLDSTFYTPAGEWKWSTVGSGSIYPEWDGPHCFQVVPGQDYLPPVMAAIGDKTVDECDNLSFMVSATDPQGFDLTLVTPVLPFGATFTDNGDGTGLFVWTPTADDAGVHQAGFLVSAATSGLGASELINITVIDGCDEPNGQGYLFVDHISSTGPIDTTFSEFYPIYSLPDLILNIRLTNQTESFIHGFTNGFQIYSPSGHSWTSTIGEFTGAITPEMVNQTFVNDFANGSGIDTIGFAGFRIMESGVPTGFDEIVWTIKIGPFAESLELQIFCIDTSYYAPAGVWKWSISAGDFYPGFTGDKCFHIYNPPTDGWRADIISIGEDSQSAIDSSYIAIGVSVNETMDAPPVPPEYTTNLRDYRPDFSGPYFIDIRDQGMEEYYWILEVDPMGNLGGAMQRCATLKWHPTQFSPDKNYYLREGFDGTGAIVVSDMRIETSYEICGSDPQMFTLHWAPKICEAITLSTGWNLVSIPFELDNNDIATLFPTATAYFGFDNGYSPATVIEPYKGYWVKVPETTTLEVCGIPLPGTNLPLSEGWSLVGGMNCPVTPYNVGEASFITAIFGFDNGYYPTQTFMPYYGYWIKLNQASDVVLECSTPGSAKLVNDYAQDNNFIKLNVTGEDLGEVNTYDVILGVDNSSASIPAPPSPPKYSAKMALYRISGEGPFYQDVLNRADETNSWVLAINPHGNIISGSERSAKLSWNKKQFGDDLYILREGYDGSGQILIDDMSKVSEFTVTGGNQDIYFTVHRLSGSTPDNMPLAYQLYQCYPNPFNPSTTISYDLAKPSQVKLVIYDLLGRQVDQLVSGYEAAGHKKVVWDGTNSQGDKVASGVYFYRISTGDFEDTRKMVLMK